MGTQNNVVLNIERILSIACRMVLRKIKQLKVEQIQLNLRTFHHVKAHAGEYLQELILNEGNRMNAADGRMLMWLRDVNRFAFELLFLFKLLDFLIQ